MLVWQNSDLPRTGIFRRSQLGALAFLITLAVAIPHSVSAETVQRIGAGSWPISDAVIVPAGYETIYVSGQTASDPLTPKVGDTGVQTTAALTRIKRLLKAHGFGMGDIVQLHMFLAPDHHTGNAFPIAAMQKSYNAFFGTPAQPYRPSRSTLGVAALGDNSLIEIEAIAVRKR